MESRETSSFAREIRRIVLRESKRANVGHIGSSLCVADILAVLFNEILRVSAPDDPDRDRFILSKGHAGLALFAALALKGRFPMSEMGSFFRINTFLGVHPEVGLPGVDFSTGSLGQGLSFAVGAALAAKLQRSGRRVFCLISDAECNEGVIWEAAMFASHHGLDNLSVILDANGQQALGLTGEVLDASSLNERWTAFGWRVTETDGHDLSALAETLRADALTPGWPSLTLAHTVFGKGVSYMEQGRPLTQRHLPVRMINWHYLPMSDAEYAIALSEVDALA